MGSPSLHESIYSLADGHLGCFQFLINKAAMSIHVQVFVRTYAFVPLGQKSLSRMADHMVLTYFTLKILPNCFLISWTILHFYQQRIRVVDSLHVANT